MQSINASSLHAYSFDHLRETNYQLFVILLILQTYNVRISEILEAEFPYFHPDKFLILKGKKRSADIIIRDRYILTLVSNLPRLHERLIFFPINYKTVYRYIKRNYSHLFAKYKTKKNYKVTHAFRYANVENVSDPSSLQAILHHNSKKSQKYYKR